MRVYSIWKRCKNHKCDRYELHTVYERSDGVLILTCLACRHESIYGDKKSKKNKEDV